MKRKSFFLALSLVLMTTLTCCASEQEVPAPDSSLDSNKTLLVFFSWSNNTKTVADEIHGMLGCDMVQVETVEPYPTSYEELRPIAYEELDNGSRELKTVVENMDEYDTLIIGTPIWGGHMTPAMQLFLKSYDFSGKTIALYTTHQGSGLGQSMSDLRSICPNSIITEGIAIQGPSASSSRSAMESWLKRIGFLNESGIASVLINDEKSNSTTYTLNGQKLSKAMIPGLYIIDGKKVLLR